MYLDVILPIKEYLKIHKKRMKEYDPVKMDFN
jgi:hypothetical protein